MQTAARKSLLVPANIQRNTRPDGGQKEVGKVAGPLAPAVPKQANFTGRNSAGPLLGMTDRQADLTAASADTASRKARVFVAAENRLVREALSRMLRKAEDIEIFGTEVSAPFPPETLLCEPADILLLSSQGNLSDDLQVIRKVRAVAPDVQILLIGMSGEDIEFLQCVRSGVRGYLLRDASTDDVLGAVRALHAGQVVCPGTLCGLLFRYFEREARSLPSASVHQQLGLTRREQQLIPLIAEGRTNKEIANHFCLSEQTVKNHLYRMKHKVGAGDRLGIVQVCRTQGFLV
jgi:DNA-binding NarL/FixJ family response regulator